MNTALQEKYHCLQHLLADMKSLAVAFSGGVDSSLLLYVAHQVLENAVVAVTIQSPYIPQWEIEEARTFTRQHGIKHIILQAAIPDIIRLNPEERCYLCKRTLFSTLLETIGKEGIQWLAEGTNADDETDYRPGLKALQELGVRSPLREAALTKEDIRLLSKELGLPTWNKPAYACLLTRLPYHTPVTENILRQIEHAEEFLMDMGIRDIRVRHHNDIARIETGTNNFNAIVINAPRIQQFFIQLGYKYVTLDLGGYRMGSFNSSLFSRND